VTLPIWVWVLSWVVIGYLASTVRRLAAEVHEYRTLMVKATQELRACEAALTAASSAVQRQADGPT
jgi:hypothetical protein